MKYYVGIDPGSKGAVVVLDEDCNIIYLSDLDKNLETYYNIYYDTICNYDSDTQAVAVEDVCGRPGQSCAANTTFMKLAGYAEFLGWMMQYGARYEKVKPQVWKKYYGLIFGKDVKKSDKKKASVMLARKLFPDKADFFKLSKDGRAEAALIARYLYVQCENQLRENIL